MMARRQQGAPLEACPVGRRRFLGLAAAVAGAPLLAACGGAGTGGAPTAAAAAPVAPTTAAVAAASSPDSAAATVRKANANTASQAEIAQALQDAGVPNADRWAREVMEYRPYPADDPSFAKLRGELAKYNPGPGVVDQIIAALTP